MSSPEAATMCPRMTGQLPCSSAAGYKDLRQHDNALRPNPCNERWRVEVVLRMIVFPVQDVVRWGDVSACPMWHLIKGPVLACM